MKAKRQDSGTLAVGQEAEVADAHEALGRQVQQETAQELVERKSQQLLFVVVSGITPAKSDLSNFLVAVFRYYLNLRTFLQG
jgi:hypothetical protein